MSRRTHFARLPLLTVLIALALALPAGCTNQATPTPSATAIDIAIASPTAEPTLEFTATPEPTEVATPTPTQAPTPTPTLAPTPTPTVYLPDWTPLPPTTKPEPTDAPPTDGPNRAARSDRRWRHGPGQDRQLAGDADRRSRLAHRPARHLRQARLSRLQRRDVPVELRLPRPEGSTYIYAHARTGMFLPFLNQSKINNGAAMIGMEVRVYTRDKKLHLYRIFKVKRHATDFSLATNLRAGEHRLIMQTSEGPHGTIPKLQVAAKPIGVYASTAAAALPTPHPKSC